MKQKVRQKWLKQGHLNTKFFHSSVKWTRAINELHGVVKNGRWCASKEVVKDKVKNFFEAKFVGNEELPVKLDNVKFNSISEVDNQMLVGAFNEEEIKEAVWSCDSSKSPSPYGFNLGFIKFSWEFIKADIMAAVKDFECSSKWPRGLNASFLCLIPKVDNSQQLGEFQPILLVECMYKIVLKALSLRLKKVISKVINIMQSAFLEGRGLLGSVLVVNEVLDEMTREKKRCVFFKVDYEKAYDSVRWEFIYYMLERVGFCGKWIKWIKGCLESATVSI